MAWAIASGQIPGSTTTAVATYGAVRTAMLLAALLDGPHAVLVEVGSGSGIATRCFPHLPGNRLAVGVDVERGSLRKAVETSDRVDYLAATADAGLPFRIGSVDSVVASEVYEHLSHPGLHRGGPADPEAGRPAGPDHPEHGIDRPHVPPAPPPRTGESGPVPVGRAATIPPSGILRPV